MLTEQDTLKQVRQ